jgi:hypothetical protein
LLARPKDPHEGKHQPPLRGELPVDLAAGEADRIPLEGRKLATPLLKLAAGEVPVDPGRDRRDCRTISNEGDRLVESSAMTA